MYKILLTLIIAGLVTSVFAKPNPNHHKVFYYPSENFWITDVSGEKTKEEIKKQYGKETLPLEIDIDNPNKYNARYDEQTGELYLYDFDAENKQIVDDKKTEIETKIATKKTELEAAGFTKEQIRLIGELDDLTKKAK